MLLLYKLQAGAEALEKTGIKLFGRKYRPWANRIVGDMSEIDEEDTSDPFEGASTDGALVLEEIMESDEESDEEMDYD